MTRLALAAAALALAGCVRPDLPTCGDLTCPPGTRCIADLEICASQSAIDTCTGSASDTLCTVGDIDGSCEASMDVPGGEVCVGEVCGDGKVTGREQCDGGIGTKTCLDFDRYYGQLQCSASCLYDISGCTGYCGDGTTQMPIEDCDTAPPDYTCVARDFDYGHLQCSERCTDTSLTDCGDLTPKTLLGASLGTSGASFETVYITSDISLYATSDGLTVFDHGVETDFSSTGNIHAITSSNGVYYITNANDVDKLAGDAQNLTLQPVAAAPPFAAGAGIFGLAADSHGTLYAVASDCTWATFDGTQWAVQPDPVPSDATPPNCSSPRAIAISATDEVYAVDHTGLVSYRTSSGWIGLTTIVNGHLNPSGSNGHVLLAGAASGTSSGIYTLSGTQARPVPIAPPTASWPQAWSDAVAIPQTDAYIALNASGAWWLAANAPPIAIGTWRNVGTAIGRMPDGHVVTWGSVASALTPMAASAINLDNGGAPSYGGVLAYGSSFIGWTTGVSPAGQVIDVSTGTSYFTASAGDPIVDVSVVGSGIYIATEANLYYSTGAGVPTTVCSFATESPISIAGTGGGNGYVATFDSATMKYALYQFAASVTGGGCTPMTAPTGKLFAIATSPAGALYAGVITAPDVSVEQWNAQTSSWQLLHSVTDSQGHDLTVLPDATIVLCGQDRVSIGTFPNGVLTWQDLKTGARRASGTSATDIWFTQAVARASVMASLTQWNGSDLAPVNEITNNLSAVVAATPDVVMLANPSGSTIYALLRFAIP